MEDAIRVENLVKNFGKGDTFVEIIKEATFSIKKGELVALIAPSGAGKTTLLLMIGCVLSQPSGTLDLGEVKVYDTRWLTKEKRKI
ncbi:MAG TPA: ATP-binding cassette domain-containing protein, partial [Nitratifractor sp.]|nr:ATP-binding cassette domain-containing protein [Nitratifractor sp.]